MIALAKPVYELLVSLYRGLTQTPGVLLRVSGLRVLEEPHSAAAPAGFEARTGPALGRTADHGSTGASDFRWVESLWKIRLEIRIFLEGS